MNQFTGNKTIKFLSNTIILSAILTMLLIITGMMPYLINLATAILTGDTEAVIRYGFGAIGLVVGFIVAILGLIIGLASIPITLAIIYTLWKRRRSASNN